MSDAASRFVEALDPNDIIVGERLRSLDRDTIERLKASIASIGLRTPIAVRRLNDGGRELVAGHHRLLACIELGLEEVPVREETGTELDAKLWEIAENLHRSELTALERAEHIEQWRNLALIREKQEKENAQVAHLAPGKPSKAQTCIAREIGFSRREVQRAETIANLPERVKQQARELELDDNQSALLAASNVATPEEQIAALQKHAQRSKCAPLTLREKILRLWKQTTEADREWLLAKFSNDTEEPQPHRDTPPDPEIGTTVDSPPENLNVADVTTSRTEAEKPVSVETGCDTPPVCSLPRGCRYSGCRPQSRCLGAIHGPAGNLGDMTISPQFSRLW